MEIGHRGSLDHMPAGARLSNTFWRISTAVRTGITRRRAAAPDARTRDQNDARARRPPLPPAHSPSCRWNGGDVAHRVERLLVGRRDQHRSPSRSLRLRDSRSMASTMAAGSASRPGRSSRTPGSRSRVPQRGAAPAQRFELAWVAACTTCEFIEGASTTGPVKPGTGW